jgi:hypothetical protein
VRRPAGTNFRGPRGTADILEFPVAGKLAGNFFGFLANPTRPGADSCSNSVALHEYGRCSRPIRAGIFSSRAGNPSRRGREFFVEGRELAIAAAKDAARSIVAFHEAYLKNPRK